MERPKSIEKLTAYKLIFAILGLIIAGAADLSIWLWLLGFLLGWTISWLLYWLAYGAIEG